MYGQLFGQSTVKKDSYHTYRTSTTLAIYIGKPYFVHGQSFPKSTAPIIN